MIVVLLICYVTSLLAELGGARLLIRRALLTSRAMAEYERLGNPDNRPGTMTYNQQSFALDAVVRAVGERDLRLGIGLLIAGIVAGAGGNLLSLLPSDCP